MASIYKIIRDNDINLLNYLIDASTGDQHQPHAVPKQFIQSVQQQLKASGTKYFDINKRSVHGRTALHCAATWNRIEMAQALIDCPAVNVNLKDNENGWTALHRALYMGNLEIARMLIAREGIDLGIKDWEGLDAFELFNSTVSDTFPKEQIRQIKSDDDLSLSKDQDEHWETYSIQQTEEEIKVGKGGTDLYTWGYNTNYVLGHADSENRLKPERVNLQLHTQQSPRIMTRPSCAIESVTLSKYHMAVLTSEPQHNLYLCGFGRGGRLGTGKELDAQFTPIPLQWPERIVSVALGRDHTVAITASGNVLSFGQNDYGQLGYETEYHSKEESPMQLVPRKIQAQSLKKQPILGTAASRVHTVVYTTSDIFTFGYNQGQLGYHQPDSDPCQTVPRKVSMSTKILQVVANDNVTAILNTSHEIILLCNFNQQKLFLPTQRFPKTMQVHRSEVNFAVKLVSSGTEHLAAVTNAGDVFIWTCRSPHARPTTEQMSKKQSNTNVKKTIISTPKCIWTVRKAHLAAVDASIGQHGEIIICTLSGLVFVGRPEQQGYKFTRIPSIQRCIRVCANSSGAFAAIRSEYQLQPITNIPNSTLVDNMMESLPHARAALWLKKEYQRIEALEIADLNKLTSKYSKYQNSSNQPDTKDLKDFNDEKNVLLESYRDLRNTCVDKAWRRSDQLAMNDTTLDIILVLGERSVYCHSSILRCRSKVFKQLVKCQDRLVGGDIKVKLNKRDQDQKIEIHIENCHIASVLLLLDYIYTDEYQHPMSMRFELPNLSSVRLLTPSGAKTIQKNLVNLAKIFHIPDLIVTAQENYYRKIDSMQEALRHLLKKAKGTNVVIKSQNDDLDTKCHEVILRQRCPYFGEILKAGTIWVQDRRDALNQEQDHVQINLDHIPKETLDVIIQYIYTDEDGSTLFADIEKDKEEQMMYFLLTLLCEADFLLLDRLKSIVENALVRFIKLRSAAVIFEYADIYLAESLKDRCLRFISVNLPAFLGSSMLDPLSPLLIRDLEKYIRNCQTQETPGVSRGEFTYTTDDSYLEVEDPEFSTSIFATTKADNSVSKYAEILVTLYSEKLSTAEKSPKNVKLDATFNKMTSPTVVENLTSPPPMPKADSGRYKKGTRVSLGDLENELNLLAVQPRRASSGWALAPTDIIAESAAKPSLRDIIQTENQPSTASSKNAKSPVSKKISQKERRKQSQKQVLEVFTDQPSSSSRGVWGKLPVVEAQPIQLPIIKETKMTMASPKEEDSKGKKIYVTEELLDTMEESSSSRTTDSKKKEDPLGFINTLGPSFNLTPIRRLQFNQQESKEAKESFKNIQNQQQLEDDWRKNFNPKKNIMKIQKEEQAIESIAQYYVQTMEILSGEWFEVRRLTAS